VEYDPDTGTVQIPNPFEPGSIGTVPATVETTGLTPGQIAQQLEHPSTVSTGGTQAFDLGALKWLGSLVLLWLILTAMTEYSPNMARLGKAMAGLILLGALYYLGPGAISNIQNLWKKPGEAGPNPIPGA